MATLRTSILWLAGLLLLPALATAQRDGSTPERALRSAPPDMAIFAQVQSNRVVIGDRFTFRVTVQGALSVEQRRVPSFASLRQVELLDGPTLSTEMTVTGSRTRMASSDVYTLRAVEKGTVVIPPAQVRLNGVWYETDPVTVEVVDVPALEGDGLDEILSARTNRSELDRELRNRYFALIELPDTIYRGQAVPIELYVYRAPTLPPLARWEMVQQPGGRDFVTPSSVDQRAISQQLRWESVTVGGQEFLRALVYTNYVVPMRTGTLRLEPPLLRVHLPAARSRNPLDDFMSGRSATVVAELPVHSRNLTVEAPPAKPDEAVAQLVGSVAPIARLDRQEVPQRELVTVTVNLRGEGFFDLVSPPELPSIPGLSYFDRQSSSQTELVRGVLLSEREFQFLYQASEPGEVTIPEIAFAVFNPATGEQQVRRTEPVQLRITPAQAGARRLGGGGDATGAAAAPPRGGQARVVGQDVAYIDTTPLTAYLVGSTGPAFYTRPWFWLIQIAILAAALSSAGLIVWRRRNAVETADRRLKRARRTAAEALAFAEGGIDRAEREEFYTSLKNGVVAYTASLLSRPEQGLTEEEASEALGRLGYDPALGERLRRIWAECDAIRYSPAPDNPDTRRKALEDARTLITSLEARQGTT